jgi:nitrate/nitrite transport system permease protein
MSLSALNRPWLLSLGLALAFLLAWQLSVVGFGSGSGPSAAAVDPEYAKLMGQGTAVAPNRTAFPSPVEVLSRGSELARHAFDRNGTNDIGIAWHLGYSLMRVLSGYAMAVLVAIPLGIAIGLVPRLYTALNPFIQIMKPISPMAWMPLALYTLKDSGASAIFIIFICSLWPLLINTAFGVISVRRDWLNVARVLGLGVGTRIRRIVLPSAVPMILTGMRISIGTAWFVIVAAEMVVGQSGVGYFIWNQWNNLDIAGMINAIFLIGAVGLGLDLLLAYLTQRLAFRE